MYVLIATKMSNKLIPLKRKTGIKPKINVDLYAEGTKKKYIRQVHLALREGFI